jgi:hypothetical protein
MASSRTIVFIYRVTKTTPKVAQNHTKSSPKTHQKRRGSALLVSIQLISPQSGECLPLTIRLGHFNDVSIQLISPQSGEIPPLKPITGKVSRGSLRGSGKITKKIPTPPQKENLKPLPSKAARLPTKKRHPHPITVSLATSNNHPQITSLIPILMSRVRGLSKKQDVIHRRGN